MTRAQAAQWLEISLTALDRALTEDLASIRLAIGGALRIPLGAVIDYADSRKGEGAVTAKFAGKMLGVSNKKISEISSGTDNLLSRQHVPGSHGELYIVTDSLLSLIARHVASGTAEDWWRLRCKYGFEPLLTLEAVRKEHHVHERTINRAIYLGELPCLFLPGTTKLIRRIPKHAAEQWTMAREAMAPSDLAQMLGASVEAVQKWNRQRVLCRTAHRGRLKAMTCPSLNCIYQYLLAKQINRFDPWIWITNRQTNKTPLYSFSPSKGVQTTLEREVWTDIHAGRLYAVTLPDGQIVVMGAR